MQTKKLFDAMRRPLSAKDLDVRLGMSHAIACQTLKRLAKHGCIVKVAGNVRTGIYYEWVPGAQLPPDRRGTHANSRAALQRRAARPQTVTVLRP